MKSRSRSIFVVGLALIQVFGVTVALAQEAQQTYKLHGKTWTREQRPNGEVFYNSTDGSQTMRSTAFEKEQKDAQAQGINPETNAPYYVTGEKDPNAQPDYAGDAMKPQPRNYVETPEAQQRQAAATQPAPAPAPAPQTSGSQSDIGPYKNLTPEQRAKLTPEQQEARRKALPQIAEDNKNESAAFGDNKGGVDQ